MIEYFEGPINVKTLKRSYATRWIEIIHSVRDFIELIECVIDSLNIISYWNNSNTALCQAFYIKHAILQN